MTEQALFTQIEEKLSRDFKFPIESRRGVDQEGDEVQYFIVRATGLSLDELIQLDERLIEFRLAIAGDLEPLTKRVLIRAEAA